MDDEDLEALNQHARKLLKQCEVGFGQAFENR